MKSAADCGSLSEVRAEIDRLDEQMIALLSLRADYVREAARYKRSESAVAAPERQAEMLKVRRGWAEREGLEPDFVEEFYRQMIAYFISHEMKLWRAGSDASGIS